MSGAEALLRAVTYAVVTGEADPPLVEQLVSRAALQQRRYRERYCDYPVTSRDGSALLSQEPEGEED
jgi:hypothetical protein